MKKQFLKGIVSIQKEGGFNVIASTAALDRQGESIDPKGWELDNFMKNPVMLWAHLYDELPIGIAEETEVTEEGLVIKGRFADAKANPKAEQVKMLYEDGILKAVSVGFIPKERNGNLITKAELLEVSFVPVPANPEALALAVTKGMDVTLITKAEHDVCDPDSPEYDAEACAALKEKEKQEETSVQTIILSKEKFPTLADAEKWAEEHDFRHDKVDETEDSWRFRQMEPTMCQEGSFRTIELTEGVSAVICRPEKCMACVCSKSGRVLSKKNHDLIDTSIKQMTQSIAALRELLEATEPAPEKGGIIAPSEGLEKKEASGLVEIPLETLKELQSHARSADRENELTNAVLKRILKKR